MDKIPTHSAVAMASIVVVSFKFSWPDFTAATSSEVLLGVMGELYEKGAFDLRLFSDLLDASPTFIMLPFRDQSLQYKRRLGGSPSVPVNYSRRILCPCESDNGFAFYVRSSGEASCCSAY